MTPRPDPFIRPRRLAAPSLRLAVLPHAGGSGAAYHPLHRGVPDDWELLLLDLPGRGKRHTAPVLEEMAPLAALVADDLEPWAADGTPFAVFGHSLGAVLAFEAARLLQRRGCAPVWIGVSGRVAPDWGPPPGRLGAALSDDALMAELDLLGGLPERLDEMHDFRDRFLQLMRADLHALADYRPDPDGTPLDGHLTAFGAVDDPLAPPYALASWARETRGAFRRRLHSGGHFHFLGAGFPAFGDEVTREIRRALRATRPGRHEPVRG